MAFYLISYDNHPPRDYSKVYTLLNSWGAQRLLESVWLLEHQAEPTPIANAVKGALEANDDVAVIEVGARWTTIGCKPAGVALLKKNRP